MLGGRTGGGVDTNLQQPRPDRDSGFRDFRDRLAVPVIGGGYLGRTRIGASITRGDIAAFLLDQTTDTRFQNAAPAISN